MTGNWIEVAGNRIGDGDRCFIIAEAGVNHDGDIDLAHDLIDCAVAAGADAVKFQTFRAEALASPVAEKAGYQKRTTAAGESQLDMLRRLQLDDAAFAALKAHCDRSGILFLSTPFEEASADLLDRLGVAAYKLPSGEITNLPFLRYVGAKRRPVLLSTGMSRIGEVEDALDALGASGCADIALFHCTSAYPADYPDVNLRAMDTMRLAFGRPTGYSDHTLGTAVSIAAAARGAAMIEKHFTLDKTRPGPDHAASLEPDELRAMVTAIRQVEAALGSSKKQPTAAEADTARVARKSVVASRNLPAGTKIASADLAIQRPGHGLPPDQAGILVGRVLRSAIDRGTPLTWDMVE